jgi:hypothetical protein
MPFIPYNSAGGEAGSLVGTYQYKINQTNGALELWKGEEKIAEQNSDGSWFKTAVSTGVGSLHLGGGDSSDPAHSVSSSGQNVVFKNESFNAAADEAVIWFPPWQGLKKGLGLADPIAPTYLQFGDYWAAYEPNGQPHPSNIVDYDFVTTIPQSIVASRLRVIAGETYSGKVTNIIMSNPKGVELHSTSANITATAGQMFWLDYPSLYFARSGDQLRLIIRKADGTPLKVRGGLTNTALPWRQLNARTFTDIKVGNVHIGDIKEFYGTNDHNGWVLMNGRSLGTLTINQQAACASIGITGTLPDARDRFSVGAGNKYGRGANGGDLKIARSALPNVGITGTTQNGSAHNHGAGSLTAGASGSQHQHSIPNVGQASGTFRYDGTGSSGNSAPWAVNTNLSTGNDGTHSHTVTGTTADGSAHTHPFTTDSMNGNVTQTDHLPPYIAFGKFIYLGL